MYIYITKFIYITNYFTCIVKANLCLCRCLVQVSPICIHFVSSITTIPSKYKSAITHSRDCETEVHCDGYYFFIIQRSWGPCANDFKPFQMSLVYFAHLWWHRRVDWPSGILAYQSSSGDKQCRSEAVPMFQFTVNSTAYCDDVM